MPELPEVETIRRDLEPLLVGARVVSVWSSGKPLHLNRPVPLRSLRACAGQELTGLRRWGKFLLFDFSRRVGRPTLPPPEQSSDEAPHPRRAGDHVVVVHLGMTGRLSVEPASSPRVPHTHVAWALADGRELRFNDVRRFGMVHTTKLGQERTLPALKKLGVDPLEAEFDGAALHALLRRRNKDVKAFLMDQQDLAGVGNIYASEALHVAAISPRIRASRLTRARADALAAAVREVLERGIANRGTTLRDYVSGDGRPGENQGSLRVYGREGGPCPRQDGGIIRRIVQAGRSTYYCPVCQR